MGDECRSTPVKGQDGNDREQRLQQQADKQVDENEGSMGLQDGEKDEKDE